MSGLVKVVTEYDYMKDAYMVKFRWEEFVQVSHTNFIQKANKYDVCYLSAEMVETLPNYKIIELIKYTLDKHGAPQDVLDDVDSDLYVLLSKTPVTQKFTSNYVEFISDDWDKVKAEAATIDDVGELARDLPGMDYISDCPAGCKVKAWKSSTNTFEHTDEPYRKTLYSLVQHLNDTHKWSREKIADWLDELHDSDKVNLEFQPWEDNHAERKKPSPDAWKNLDYTKEEEI